MGHWLVTLNGKTVQGRELPEGILHNKLRQIYVMHYAKEKYGVDAATHMYIQTDGVEKQEHFTVELKPLELKRILVSLQVDYYTRDKNPDEWNMYIKGLEEIIKRKEVESW